MAPLRRDGQPDLGLTPMEFARLQAQQGKSKRRIKEDEALVTEAEILSGPGGMTPMEFAAWQAEHPNEAGTALGSTEPGGSDVQGDGSTGTPIVAVAGEGVSPLAQPIQ